MGEGLQDPTLANCLAQSAIQGGDGIKSAGINVIAHSRPTKETRLKLLEEMGLELQRLGSPNLPIWQALYHHFEGTRPANQSNTPPPATDHKGNQSQVARLIPVRLSPPKAPTSSSDPELREEAYGVLLDEYSAPEEA